MNTLQDVEKTLTGVEHSLKTWVRNDYERRNLTSSNLARLGDARMVLSKFSGDYVTTLVNRITALEKKIINNEAEYQKPTESSAFRIDFECSDNVDEEIAVAEKALQQQERAKSDKRKARRGAGGARKPQLLVNDDVGEAPPLPPLTDLPEEVAPAPSAFEEVRGMRTREIARFSKQSSCDIPAEAIGSGMAFQVPDSPFVGLEFDKRVEYDLQPCYCRVEMYKCVLISCLRGKPKIEPVACGVTNVSNFNCETKTQSTGEDESSLTDEDDSRVAVVVEGGAGSLDDIAMLSEQLIQDFKAEEAAEAEALSGNSFPLKVSEEVSYCLRAISNSTWTVILCHGGFFAGGVFQQQKCVRHKAFQRYVVRKKQGGKQSNAQKDGGSFGSIGSQIRAANELKWRVDVRDILLEWRPYIDMSSVILYVAPGPSNRSILADFSLIPQSEIRCGKGDEPSPIDLKDPRVRSVPLSTHRPSFAEVQRIFSEINSFKILYVQ